MLGDKVMSTRPTPSQPAVSKAILLCILMILSSLVNYEFSDPIEDDIVTDNPIFIFHDNDKKSSTNSQLLYGSNSSFAYEKINAFYHADNIETAIKIYDSVSVYNKTVIVGSIDGSLVGS